MAFVAGGMATIKVQAKRHEKASQAEKIATRYFKTREEALFLYHNEGFTALRALP